MNDYEVRTTPVGELRVLMQDGHPIVVGSAIVFNEWSCDLGGFRERILPGAPVLDPDLKALFDHQTAYVIGSLRAGTMDVSVTDDCVGMTARPPETTWAADMLTSMKRGDIDGMSFAMRVREDKWYVEAGQVCRDVIAADVAELTITSMPAYPQTTAEARSKAMATRETIFADTLLEADQSREASWSRLYQLESALEKTVTDALCEGDRVAALAAVTDFASEAATWVQIHADQLTLDAAEATASWAMYSRLAATRSRITAEMRAGRVLSQANEKALSDAIELIEQGVENIESVLSQVDPTWVDDNDEDTTEGPDAEDAASGASRSSAGAAPETSRRGGMPLGAAARFLKKKV